MASGTIVLHGQGMHAVDCACRFCCKHIGVQPPKHVLYAWEAGTWWPLQERGNGRLGSRDRLEFLQRRIFVFQQADLCEMRPHTFAEQANGFQR
jgi:hypothetical protein